MGKSQRDVVLEILKDKGVIDNFWAFNNYILRLGAIIFELRREGYIITTKYEHVAGKKNCHYYLQEGVNVSQKNIVEIFTKAKRELEREEDPNRSLLKCIACGKFLTQKVVYETLKSGKKSNKPTMALFCSKCGKNY